MNLDEPVTTLGDYALCVFLVVLGVLTPLIRPERPSALWAAGFIASAVAAGLGGTSHGFGPRLSAQLAAQIWRATLFAAHQPLKSWPNTSACWLIAATNAASNSLIEASVLAMAYP